MCDPSTADLIETLIVGVFAIIGILALYGGARGDLIWARNAPSGKRSVK